MAENNRYRKRRFCIHLSDAEYVMLEFASKSMNCTKSDYIRYIITAGLEHVHLVSDQDKKFYQEQMQMVKDELNRIRKEVNAIGTNINQIAYQANQKKYSDEKDFDEVWNMISSAQEQLIYASQIFIESSDSFFDQITGKE